MKKRFMLITIIMALILCIGMGIAITYAEQAQRKIEKLTRTPKEVAGEVVYLGYDKIIIFYGADEAGTEHEIMFSFDRKNIELQHIRGLESISRGDQVTVQFEEERLKYEGEADEQVSLKAKVISLIKKGSPHVVIPPKVPQTDEETDEEDEAGPEVLRSDE